MPREAGGKRSPSDGLASPVAGVTENMTASWCPWYEPMILQMRSRPVTPRATRMASIVASVPELVSRTRSNR